MNRKASFNELAQLMMSLDIQGAIIQNITDLPPENLAVICDLAEKLSGKNGGQWLSELKEFINKKSPSIDFVKGNVLRLISGGEYFTIDPVNGTESLVKATEVFVDIENYKKISDKGGSATKETPVEIYEMIERASWPTMFRELNPDVRKLCLTQHQIKSFIAKYRQKIQPGKGWIVFPFEYGGEILVAVVSSQYRYINQHVTWDGRHFCDVEYIPDKLRLHFGHSESTTTHNPNFPHKIVVPRSGINKGAFGIVP